MGTPLNAKRLLPQMKFSEVDKIATLAASTADCTPGSAAGDIWDMASAPETRPRTKGFLWP